MHIFLLPFRALFFFFLDEKEEEKAKEEKAEPKGVKEETKST